MTPSISSADYWNNRYLQNETGWDMGIISPPLKAYFDQLSDKTISILIPGGGNSYEANYLLENGFTHITVIDIAEILITRLRKNSMNIRNQPSSSSQVTFSIWWDNTISSSNRHSAAHSILH